MTVQYCIFHGTSKLIRRHFGVDDGDDSEIPKQESRHRHECANISRDLLSGLSLHELVPRLEPFFRSVVQEEVALAVQRFFHSSARSSFDQIESSGATACWQLQFHNKLPSTLFTSNKVESEDSEPIKLVLVDAKSKKMIASGPLSSIKIEVVALDGAFANGESGDWTENDFNACVIREREGKRPLVTGDLVITLRNGVADLDNICFTDNSSWIKCRKFRLGARVKGISTDVRVREAISEAFVVKDYRGVSYQKHYPPSLVDQVWRLEKIAKDGRFHNRLVNAGISTVKEFLCLYVTDPSSLRNVLGGGISNRTWDTIIEHASTCVLDDKMYLYYGAAQSVVLIFNSIWKVIGAFDGENYLNLDKLNTFEMRLVEDVKRQAYKNLNELVLYDEQSFVGPSTLMSSLQAEPLSNPNAVLQNVVNTPVADQDQLQMQLDTDLVTTSPPYSFEVDNCSQLEASPAHNFHSIQAFPSRNSFVMNDFCYGSYSEGYSAGPSGSLGSVVMTGDDISQVGPSTWQGNGFFLGPSNQSVEVVSSNLGYCFSDNRKPKARWCKIRAAIKWSISVRRDVAAKRMATRQGLCI